MANISGMSTPNRDEIKRRAYLIRVDGGCQPDTELDNWIEAERQILTEMLEDAEVGMKGEDAPPSSAEVRPERKGAAA